MIGGLQDIFLPSGFATLLFLAGLVTVVARRTRRLGCRLLAAAAAVFVIFSNGLVATLLMIPLEYAHPALLDPREHMDTKAIVVLTAYAAGDANMPESAHMNAASAFRILEAANLSFLRPDCRVIVTGSAEAARIMGHQLQTLGVPDERLSIDMASDSTAASAQRLKSLIGDNSLFLVTSAGHMRRAMGVFRKNGMRPIPAPTDYQLPGNALSASWTTSPVHLEASDLAVHEYFALAWYSLTNKI